jgi:dipeptidyl aminopeptidase/acylaminoacyl peptidase
MNYKEWHKLNTVVCWFFLIIIFVACPTYAGNTDTPPTEIFKFKRITYVAVSPDSSKVAYSTFSLKTDGKKKYWQHQLYLQTANTKPILLVTTNNTIVSPLWSDDGKKIAYMIKDYTKHTAVLWVFNINQHTSNKLLSLNRDIIACAWSPDGSTVAFIAQDLDRALTPNPYKPIDADQDYINVRLYLAVINGQKQPQIVPLSPADCSICYELGINGNAGFDWSPDGKKIAYAYQPQIGFDYVSQSKINIINLVTHQITAIPYMAGNTGINPMFSPDGRWLAFASSPGVSTYAQELTDVIAINSRICVTDLKQITHTFCLSNTPNENPQMIGWDKNSTGVFVYDSYKTQGPQIYHLSLNAAAGTKLLARPQGYLNPLTLSLNDSHTTFGFAFETINNPPEVFTSAANQQALQLKQISHMSSAKQPPLGQVKQISWKAKDGKIIEGLLITPVNYNPQQKYPLFVMAHGGPYQIAWSERYLGRSEEFGRLLFDPTSYVSAALHQGFVVFQPNYRGSNGYGKDFRVANYGDFGGKDYDDIMAGVDYLVQQGIADEEHMAIAGWSFGGYLTSLAIGRSDRFKAAIEGAGITNMISFAGTSDMPELFKKNWGSFFWENEKLFWQRSPMSQVKNIHTPLLILHGKSDDRSPVSQGYELYHALKLQNKQVSMLVFPDEPHIFADPNRIWAAIEATYVWLEKAL